MYFDVKSIVVFYILYIPSVKYVFHQLNTAGLIIRPRYYINLYADDVLCEARVPINVDMLVWRWI